MTKLNSLYYYKQTLKKIIKKKKIVKVKIFYEKSFDNWVLQMCDKFNIYNVKFIFIELIKLFIKF